jgi:D-3-phosphoglycerate dehydrogenase
MEQFRVFVAEKSYADYEEERSIVEKAGGTLLFANCRSEQDIIEQCSGAHAILLRQTPVGKRVFRALSGLKVVSRYGAGCDNIDIPAATRFGVVVTAVTDYCTGEVADHTIALLLSLIRRIPLRDRLVRAGSWDLGTTYPVHRTAQKEFGFVGYGKTAREVRKRLSGFPFRFYAYDPYIDRSIFEEEKTSPLDFNKLAIICDYVSIHVPLSEQTHHLFDLTTFRMMKKNALLINTSRGAVIDQRALYTALKEGLIGGAGLDVYETEPFDTKNPLRDLDSVILTDHAAWYSEESRHDLQHRAAEDAVRVLTGKLPTNPVNPEVLSQKIISMKREKVETQEGVLCKLSN